MGLSPWETTPVFEILDLERVRSILKHDLRILRHKRVFSTKTLHFRPKSRFLNFPTDNEYKPSRKGVPVGGQRPMSNYE